MRLAARVLWIAMVGGVALAAPTPAQAEPRTCGVAIVRAPDDLRADLEVRLALRKLMVLRDCRPALQVWATAEADGVHLRAQDPYGRSRERVVPDPTTAEVLLASWVEIDAEGGSGAIAAGASAPEPDAWSTPPGMVPAVVAAAATPAEQASSIAVTMFLTKSASGSQGGGARFQIDLWRLHGFALGTAVVARGDGSSTHLYGNVETPAGQRHELGRDMVEAYATVRRPLAMGRWEVLPAASIGLGLAHHTLDFQSFYGVGQAFQSQPWTMGPRAELSAGIGRRIGARWEVEVACAFSGAVFWQLRPEIHDLPVIADSYVGLELGVRRLP
jgi:hypothetical protein